MKATPQNIASELNRRGIPIVKRTKKLRSNGVKIRSIGNRITCEWVNWDKMENIPDNLVATITEMGYKLIEVRNTGIYVIVRV